MFAVRGMQRMSEAVEAYFAPASKLRRHTAVAKTCYVLRGWRRAPRDRDERIFEAVGTWGVKLPAT
jgi:hypothetical protein